MAAAADPRAHRAERHRAPNAQATVPGLDRIQRPPARAEERLRG